MRAGLLDVAERGLVAREIIVVGRLGFQRSGTAAQEFERLAAFAQLVQAKCGVDEACVLVRRDAAQLAADFERELPAFGLHQHGEAGLDSDGAAAHVLGEKIQFVERQLGKAELAVALCCEQQPLVRYVNLWGHGFQNARKKRCVGTAGKFRFSGEQLLQLVHAARKKSQRRLDGRRR